MPPARVLDYVQAGGGNTSVKSPDGHTMAIKASGTALTAMSESAGWVEVERRGGSEHLRSQ